ncbi:acyl-CoA thioesterase [Secundilactobacillus collinoides]|uniref:HotDog ACOT-type domain-containing protein n=1 Tax=Secundilactobacillus collinoides TaxID=33960 RepID=A0A166G7X0_SECCO|nr:hotdog domain-containing protein [Secundilactobacillus collinoides]KZL37152.1 hypothetical protein TY91_13035 [Secundilactobacillus collinoides]
MTTEKMTCRATRSLTNHRVFLADINEHGTVFGGRTLALIDDSSSVSAARVSKQIQVTAAMDHMQFVKPFAVPETMIIDSYVTGTSKRSMEVFVKAVGEDLTTGKRFLGFTCFVTFVTAASPADPTLPIIVPETAEEKFLCAGYEARVQERKAGRATEKETLSHIELGAPEFKK